MWGAAHQPARAAHPFKHVPESSLHRCNKAVDVRPGLASRRRRPRAGSSVAKEVSVWSCNSVLSVGRGWTAVS